MRVLMVTSLAVVSALTVAVGESWFGSILDAFQGKAADREFKGESYSSPQGDDKKATVKPPRAAGSG
jgi:hypothetical protein